MIITNGTETTLSLADLNHLVRFNPNTQTVLITFVPLFFIKKYFRNYWMLIMLNFSSHWASEYSNRRLCISSLLSRDWYRWFYLYSNYELTLFKWQWQLIAWNTGGISADRNQSHSKESIISASLSNKSWVSSGVISWFGSPKIYHIKIIINWISQFKMMISNSFQSDKRRLFG